MSIEENVKAIKEKMRQAAIEAGRNPDSVLLCAATKMNDAEAVRRAIRAGVDCCGENKVQELTEKLAQNAYEGAPVHFIGHLQTNKVKFVVGKVDLIQSVDSLRLLEAIEKQAAKIGCIQDVLLEVNIALQESKSGFTLEELPQILEKMGQFSNICVRGFMAIPPIAENSTGNHKFFQEMCNLSVDITTKKYDNVRVDILSMGMSDDYSDAIACGSTMVRVGTAIFGRRNYVTTHS
jgi:pyridoxal phosphate enzyme (YggS family)